MRMTEAAAAIESGDAIGTQDVISALGTPEMGTPTNEWTGPEREVSNG